MRVVLYYVLGAFVPVRTVTRVADFWVRWPDRQARENGKQLFVQPGQRVTSECDVTGSVPGRKR